MRVLQQDCHLRPIVPLLLREAGDVGEAVPEFGYGDAGGHRAFPTAGTLGDSGSVRDSVPGGGIEIPHGESIGRLCAEEVNAAIRMGLIDSSRPGAIEEFIRSANG